MSEQPLAVSIPKAAALSGVGRTKIYEAVRDGELPVRKAGRRSLILVADIEKWLKGLPVSAPPEAA